MNGLLGVEPDWQKQTFEGYMPFEVPCFFLPPFLPLPLSLVLPTSLSSFLLPLPCPIILCLPASWMPQDEQF